MAVQGTKNLLLLSSFTYSSSWIRGYYFSESHLMDSIMEGKTPQKLKIGRYILGETLGAGTFGKVKIADHDLTGHKVAVKILNRNKIQHLDVADKITREIQILKLFRHPHIIKLYEVITTPKDIFMVMEYVSGGELFEYIVKHGKSSENESRAFFQQIIAGVDYCHRHKVVHRDLKPENLLLDANNKVKIADFGLSNLMKDGEFLRTSCGSPNYAAPEVVSGKLYAGPEVDVWSCGIILYALLCGSLPFEDSNISMLFRKIKSGQFYIPHYISKGASDLLTQMLQVNPVKRITLPQIKEHAWFTTELPQYLFPLPGLTEHQQIDSAVLSEVCQKLSVKREEVLQAVRSGDRGHHLAVAYELVQDNRLMQSHTQPGDDSHLLATSPITSSFIIVDTLLETDHSQRDSLTNASPVSSTGGGMTKHRSTSLVIEDSLPIRLPRSFKKPKWHLGIRSQSHPQNIMQEIMKKLKSLNFDWKVVNTYHIRCRYKKSADDSSVIKLDLQLYQLDQRNFLLDFKGVDPSEDTKTEVSILGDEGSSQLPQRHYTMEFFEACSRLICSLAQ